jgi:hypothetical protein
MEIWPAFGVDALLHAPVVFPIRSRPVPAPVWARKAAMEPCYVLNTPYSQRKSRIGEVASRVLSRSCLELAVAGNFAEGIAENANREMDIFRIAENNLCPLMQVNFS